MKKEEIIERMMIDEKVYNNLIREYVYVGIMRSSRKLDRKGVLLEHVYAYMNNPFLTEGDEYNGLHSKSLLFRLIDGRIDAKDIVWDEPLVKISGGDAKNKTGQVPVDACVYKSLILVYVRSQLIWLDYDAYLVDAFLGIKDRNDCDEEALDALLEIQQLMRLWEGCYNKTTTLKMGGDGNLEPVPSS